MRHSQRKLPWLFAMALLLTTAGNHGFAWADSGAEHQLPQDRPIELGTSGGNINDRSAIYCCSGTLGALVEDSYGIRYILSNNHVLARGNQAQLGEEINQPGQIDQGCGQTGIVGVLSDFVPIQFSKGRKISNNTVDAAIAQVMGDTVDPGGSIIDIGYISSNTMEPAIGQQVQKSGRTTGHTLGEIVSINATIDVGYSRECGGAAVDVARYENQILITDGTFSAGGDSGSLIVESATFDPNNGLPRAVGLLFAGSSFYTIANPIDAVTASLSVSMVGGSPVAPGSSGSIRGIVFNNDSGSLIEGAVVTMENGRMATTDANGSYLIDNVPVGTWTTTASANGFTSQSTEISVVDGMASQADFYLEPYIAAGPVAECITYSTEGGKNRDKHLLITLAITDETGNPLPDAQVDIAVNRDDSLYTTGSGASTDAEGMVTYSSKNAPNGVYTTAVTEIITAAGTYADVTAPDNAFNKGGDTVPTSFCLNGSGSSNSGDSARKSRHPLNIAKDVKKLHSEELMAISGVVGHGIGMTNDGKPVIEVYLAHDNAIARSHIPAFLEHIPVRIVVTGPFTAF